MYSLSTTTIVIILFMLPSLSAADPLPDTEHMCTLTIDTLCVRDTLLTIATVARSISRTASEIERTILFKYPEIETLYRYVNYEMGLVQSHLPPPLHHVKFAQLNNVDKKYLVDVLLEAHNALSYYYKSIESILRMRDATSASVDSWFEQIQQNVRDTMICGCRSVLSVYGVAWPRLGEVKQVEFSRRRYGSSPSMVHDVQSMVVVRLLREWMSRMHGVLTNMERKYYSITTKAYM